MSSEPAAQVRRAWGKTAIAGKSSGCWAMIAPRPTCAEEIPSSPRSPDPWRKRTSGIGFIES